MPATCHPRGYKKIVENPLAARPKKKSKI